MQKSNLKDLFNHHVTQLESHGITTAKQDLDIIFSYVLKTSKNKIRFLKQLNSKQSKKIKKLVKKRQNHIPIQYLVKNVEFINLKLFVNKDVLIPRNETEHLADIIIKHINLLKAKNETNVLDMCCGSGAIGLSIAKNTKSFVELADISKKALKVAKKNASFNKVRNVKFTNSDLFKKIKQKYDVFVSNPPYIKKQNLTQLEKQVRDYEPLIALDGGDDGLKFYRLIIPQLKNFLNPNAFVFFEISSEQKDQ